MEKLLAKLGYYSQQYINNNYIPKDLVEDSYTKEYVNKNYVSYANFNSLFDKNAKFMLLEEFKATEERHGTEEPTKEVKGRYEALYDLASRFGVIVKDEEWKAELLRAKK